MKSNILIIEDHYFVREAIETCVKEIDNDCNILKSSSLNEAMACLKNTSAEFKIITDLDLSDSYGFNTVKNIFNINRKFDIMIFTAHNDFELQSYFMKMGVMGYVTKNKTVDEVKASIKMFLNGEKIFDPIAYVTNSDLLEIKYLRINKLSKKEKDILKYFSEGNSIDNISNILSLSQITLNQYISNIVKKLNCKNRYTAVMEYQFMKKYGFIQ